jgi:hypothetical protein
VWSDISLGLPDTAATRLFPLPAGVALFCKGALVSLAVICDHS